MLKKAKMTKSATDWKDRASVVEVNCCSVVPAWMATNEGGATPMNVPIQNGFKWTSKTGETMLMNQLGRKGVILRNMM